MTDPFGQVRSRSRQLAVMVAVTVIGHMTGPCGHGHASTDDDMEVWDEGMKVGDRHEGRG